MTHTATLVIKVTDENPTNAVIDITVKSPTDAVARTTLYDMLDTIANQLSKRAKASYLEADGMPTLDLKAGPQVGQGPKAEA